MAGPGASDTPLGPSILRCRVLHVGYSLKVVCLPGPRRQGWLHLLCPPDWGPWEAGAGASAPCHPWRTGRVPFCRRA